MPDANSKLPSSFSSPAPSGNKIEAVKGLERIKDKVRGVNLVPGGQRAVTVGNVADTIGRAVVPFYGGLSREKKPGQTEEPKRFDSHDRESVIGSFRKGGPVRKTGAYRLHKGERVVPKRGKTR